MAKIGIIILAATDSSGDLGRAVNALETAKEFHEAGDDVQVIFDGAGTQWIKVLSDESHRYHQLFSSVRETITGACSYCAEAYGVLDAVRTAGIDLLDEHDGHPSLRKLAVAGYQLITF